MGDRVMATCVSGKRKPSNIADQLLIWCYGGILVLRSSAAIAAEKGDTTADLLNAVAAMITAIAWPMIVGILLVLNRDQFARLFARLRKIRIPGGGEFELSEEIQQSLTES